MAFGSLTGSSASGSGGGGGGGEANSFSHTDVTGNDSSAGSGIYGYSSTAAPYTFEIASADIATAGNFFIIVDESGAAGTNNITITTEGAETINGAPSATISANNGAIRLYSNGSDLFAW